MSLASSTSQLSFFGFFFTSFFATATAAAAAAAAGFQCRRLGGICAPTPLALLTALASAGHAAPIMGPLQMTGDATQ
jgi:hypothetical protein